MESSIDQKNNFYKCAIDLKIYSKPRNLKNHLSFIFKQTKFNRKRVLDIGGGAGLLSYWGALNGGKAICLEPEFDGSTKGIKCISQAFGEKLGLSNADVEFKAATFQDYQPVSPFDVIVLANSINHLNESAVKEIHRDVISHNLYVEYLEKIYSMLDHQGKVIITDCSRYNFFNLLGLKSPFMPSIEWDKHQSPYTWRRLLKSVGFENTKIHWSSPNSLGFWGKLIFANPISSFFTLSHFRIEAQKK